MSVVTLDPDQFEAFVFVGLLLFSVLVGLLVTQLGRR